MIFHAITGNPPGNRVDQMPHLQLRLFQLRNIMEHAQQQRTPILFPAPFYLDAHQTIWPVTVLFAEFKFCRLVSTNNLFCLLDHHAGVFPVDKFCRIALAQFIVFVYRIPDNSGTPSEK